MHHMKETGVFAYSGTFIKLHEKERVLKREKIRHAINITDRSPKKGGGRATHSS